MSTVQRMRYCSLCDVYVDVAATGEMVVVLVVQHGMILILSRYGSLISG